MKTVHEGWCRETLQGDRYKLTPRYSQGDRERSRKQDSLARVRVRLDRVDPGEKKISFGGTPVRGGRPG